jgi:uncharacterized membrane protein
MEQAPASVFTRVPAIDILRGIIMVVMALDHTRDYFHTGALVYDPTDLSQSNTAVFLTRWITHFCAPGFLFLAGLSAYIKRNRTSRRALARYLLTRGLWLMLLDIVVLRFAVLFNFYLSYNILSILWLIGGCMVMLAGVIYLRYWVIVVAAFAIIFGHNLADGITPGEPLIYVPWVLFWNGGMIPFPNGSIIYALYPFIPWLGIMMLGYGVGRWYGTPYTAAMRKRLLINTGILFTVLFFFFRYAGYGDPRPAEAYPDAINSILSFLNATKYPVSLQFTLMTLGPLMILLAFLENAKTERLKPLLVFGQVPLFYFIVHFFVIHTAALMLFMIQTGKPFSELDFHFPQSFGGITAEGGVSLPWVYVAWVLVVAALYPLCSWWRARTLRHQFPAVSQTVPDA